MVYLCDLATEGKKYCKNTTRYTSSIVSLSVTAVYVITRISLTIYQFNNADWKIWKSCNHLPWFWYVYPSSSGFWIQNVNVSIFLSIIFFLKGNKMVEIMLCLYGLSFQCNRHWSFWQIVQYLYIATELQWVVFHSYNIHAIYFEIKTHVKYIEYNNLFIVTPAKYDFMQNH